jgi:hypothetical protein
MSDSILDTMDAIANNEVPAVKRGRGRPPVYVGKTLAYIILVMSAINSKYTGQGNTKVRDLLTKSGAVRNALAKKYGVDLTALAVKAGLDKPAYCPKISGVTLCNLGKEHGFQLKQGRPHKAEVAKAA